MTRKPTSVSWSQHTHFPRVVEWNDVLRDWSRALSGAVGSILVCVVIALFVVFEISTWVSCDTSARAEITRAIAKRDKWCNDETESMYERMARNAKEDCIDAQYVISEGLWRGTFDCHVSSHMTRAGHCRDYSACAWLIDWAETLRNSFPLILFCAIVVFAYGSVRLLRTNATLFGNALSTVRAMDDGTLPLSTTARAQAPASDVVFMPPMPPMPPTITGKVLDEFGLDNELRHRSLGEDIYT